jgi:hypothetical protein
MRKSSSLRLAGFVLVLCSLAATALLVPAAPAVAEVCPNEQLRAEDHSTTLPDCRSYELVTPPFKEAAQAPVGSLGADKEGIYGIAPAGDRVVVNSVGDFGDATNGYTGDSYQLTRTESGWTEENVDLPQSQFPASIDIETTPELSGRVLYLAEPTGQPLDFWLREPDGALDDLGPSGGAYGFDGASADLTHVLFSDLSPLSEDILGRGGVPAPVGVEPDGAPCAAGVAGSRGAKGGFGPISADGSTAFFYCSEKLFARIDNGEAGAHTVAVSAGPASFVADSPDGAIVLYFEAGALFRLAVASGAREEVEPASAGISSVMAINETGEDAAYVYFYATGALTGANAEGRAPIAGQPNLYVLRRDAQFPSGRLSFIATTSPGHATVTPDGQFVVFTSTADLTPGDKSTAQQIFEYDAQAESLVRVSIGQGGFNDDGNTDTFNAEVSELPSVSDDGASVAFESADVLTPAALNGQENVYEYHDGNVYLISDGQSEAKLRGVSASGNDIFFETVGQLVTQDTDTQRDLYDARVDGGFPAAASPLPTCQGDACQGELSAAPTLLSPGSELQAGGNPPLAGSEVTPLVKAKPKAKTVKCKKGYVKRKSRCVEVKSTRKAGKSSKTSRVSNDRRAKS